MEHPEHENRRNLYLAFVDKKLITDTLFNEWIEQTFGTEEDIIKLYQYMNKQGWYTKDVNQFFKKYACDLYRTSKYCSGGTQQTSLNEKDTQPKLVRKGDNGMEVEEVQDLLKNTGHNNVSKSGETDGEFNHRTRNSVRDFQSANVDKDGKNLKVTGYVDKPTLDALRRKSLHENIKKIVDSNLKTISNRYL